MHPGSYSGSIYIIATLICSCVFFYPGKSSAAETYFSYLGGALTDSAYAVAKDSQNNIYITGSTNSDSFDSFDPVPNIDHDSQNCFVSRINLTNTDLNYYFEFAGSKNETCRAIAVDTSFNVYVVGETQSTDLPVTTNKTFSGVWDAFLFKLNPFGELIYASYVGGSLTDYGHGITLGDINEVYITGETWSNNFPTTTNAYIENCVALNICSGEKANAFITHINTSNTQLFMSSYSTYLGGQDRDKAHSISRDPAGVLHVAGETGSSDFPVVNAISNQLKGNFDGFVSLVDPSLDGSVSLVFSTYIGGSADDFIVAISSDSTGSSYITGESFSDDFPTTTNAFSRRCANGKLNCLPANQNQQHSDIFISKITNKELAYSTLIGGIKNDLAKTIFLDSLGYIYISGTTSSSDFPLTDNAFDSKCNISSNCETFSDGYLLKIDPTGTGKSGLQYSSFLGGDKSDSVRGLQSYADNQLIVVGETASADLASAQAIDSTQENAEAFVQIIEIEGIGNWKSDTVVEPVKTAASLINPFYLLLLIILYTLHRKNNFI